MTDRELMQQALEALAEWKEVFPDNWDAFDEQAFSALRERLAQPEFPTHEEGEDGWSDWVCPDPKSYLMKCCDCGLVHEAQFKVVRYKSEAEREDCEPVDDPNLQAVFRMRRNEQWSPNDTAYRPGGLAQPEQERSTFAEWTSDYVQDNLHKLKPEQKQWDAIPDAFNEWWNADYDDTGNPFRKDSPAYWAWSGWKAASKQPEQEPVAWEDVLGAIARGWTHDDNKHKTMDVRLAVAIAKEIQDMVIAPPQRKPPQFPTMLRKMWSGAEVQKWINENWEQA